MTDTDPAKPAEPLDTADPASVEATGERRSEHGGRADRPKEIGGRKGPDPTRYGDWEKNGRCIDF